MARKGHKELAQEAAPQDLMELVKWMTDDRKEAEEVKREEDRTRREERKAREARDDKMLKLVELLTQKQLDLEVTRQEEDRKKAEGDERERKE